jgi:hypothetical protein
MRVQAKKINFHTWCFNSLKFRPRSGAQIDKLVNAATADQLIPLYCLYGFESGKYRSPNLYNDHLQACSIIRAEEVAAMGSKAGLRLMPRSRPWHRLVCNGDCCGIKDLHDIAGWLGQLPAGDASNTSLTAVRELPDYVKDLVLETKRYPPIEWENIVADETGRGAKKRGFITIRVGN